MRKAELLRVGERYSRADFRLERRPGMVEIIVGGLSEVRLCVIKFLSSHGNHKIHLTLIGIINE